MNAEGLGKFKRGSGDHVGLGTVRKNDKFRRKGELKRRVRGG